MCVGETVTLSALALKVISGILTHQTCKRVIRLGIAYKFEKLYCVWYRLKGCGATAMVLEQNECMNCF